MSNLGNFFSLVAEEEKKKKIELEAKLEKAKAEQEIIESLGKVLSQMAENRPAIETEQVAEQVVAEQEQITEQVEEVVKESNLGLLGGTTATKTADPLTPFDQKFVTFDDLNKHYKTYIARVQQQLSTLGGGGEVNFRYLDDVNRGTMNPGNDNWVLEYDAATKKAQFTEDLGPIKTVKMNTAGPDITPVPGMLSWNTFEDCLDITQSDGTTLQAGLENYIQIINDTGSKLENGTCVRFSGVSGDETPQVQKMIGDGTVAPLIMIGILTSDIENGAIGRATILGKVRELNTTGSDVSEEWAIGSLLYVHPTIPGKLTKVQPTAPNIVVSVAAVLHVGTDDGILLVRPTIWPRLYYGVFTNTTTETAALVNTPYAIEFNVTSVASGHTIGTPISRVVAQNPGLYNYKFAAQLTSTNASTKNVWFWARKNGVNIPYSTKVVSVTGNGTNAVAGWDFNISMAANDYFQLMWAVNDTTIQVNAPAANAFSPAIPAVRLTVSQIAL